MTHSHAITAGVAVAYTVEIIRDGESVKTVTGKNLVLNGGLNEIGKMSRCIDGTTASGNALFGSVKVGSGSGPVKRGSGAVTFDFAGSGTVTVTASAGFFVAGDVGRVLKVADGTEITVTAYTSGTVVTGTTTGTPANGQTGSVHYVNDTALSADLSSTVSAGTFSNVSTSFTSATGVFAHRRTADTGTASAGCTVTEMGWLSTGGVMVGRVVLPSPLGLLTGDKVRVTLDITLTVDTAAKAVFAGSFSGNSRFYGEPATGANIGYIGGGNGSETIAVYSAARDLAQVNAVIIPTSGQIGVVAPAIANPSLGVFTYTATFSTSQGNGTIYAASYGRHWAHNLTTPFVKDNTMTMTLAFTLIFTRTLSN